MLMSTEQLIEEFGQVKTQLEALTERVSSTETGLKELKHQVKASADEQHGFVSSIGRVEEKLDRFLKIWGTPEKAFEFFEDLEKNRRTWAHYRGLAKEEAVKFGVKCLLSGITGLLLIGAYAWANGIHP
jgi:hypothetical protein